MRKLLFTILVMLSACSDDASAPLVASDVVLMKPLPGRSMSAGYLRISNNSDSDLVITEVSSPNFGRVEIHKTTIEDGVAKMRRVDALTVEAQSETVFEPGGLHLMLMKPANLGANATVNFHSDDTILLSVEVPFAPLP